MTDERKHFSKQGKAMYDTRVAARITLGQMAFALGVDPLIVSHWERGCCAPTEEMLTRYFDVCETAAKTETQHDDA